MIKCFKIINIINRAIRGRADYSPGPKHRRKQNLQPTRKSWRFVRGSGTFEPLLQPSPPSPLPHPIPSCSCHSHVNFSPTLTSPREGQPSFGLFSLLQIPAFAFSFFAAFPTAEYEVSNGMF